MRSLQRSYEGGFAGTLAITSISLTAIALEMVALGAAHGYADAAEAAYDRMQAVLDRSACDDALALIAMRDPFIRGHIRLPEFGDCEADL